MDSIKKMNFLKVAKQEPPRLSVVVRLEKEHSFISVSPASTGSIDIVVCTTDGPTQNCYIPFAYSAPQHPKVSVIISCVETIQKKSR